MQDLQAADVQVRVVLLAVAQVGLPVVVRVGLRAVAAVLVAAVDGEVAVAAVEVGSVEQTTLRPSLQMASCISLLGTARRMYWLRARNSINLQSIASPPIPKNSARHRRLATAKSSFAPTRTFIAFRQRNKAAYLESYFRCPEFRKCSSISLGNARTSSLAKMEPWSPGISFT